MHARLPITAAATVTDSPMPAMEEAGLLVASGEIRVANTVESYAA